MNKEIWEMTFNQYCKEFLNSNRYGAKYKKNPAMWEGKKNDLYKVWEQALEDRAEIGDIPEVVIRSLVNIVGVESVRRTFRGVKEKGLKSWERTQINKVLRENVKENLKQCEENLKGKILGC